MSNIKLKNKVAEEQKEIKHLTSFSHTSLSTFINCERLYLFQYVRNLEKIKLTRSDLERLVGEIVHQGIFRIYEKKKTMPEILAEVKGMFEKKLKEYKESLLLDTFLEEYFYEREIISLAMIQAYAIHYKKFIDKAKHIKNEFPFKVKTTEMNGEPIYIKGKIDNILEINGLYFIHEVKTTKYINKNYVDNIRLQRQPAIYHHYFNKKYTINGKKITGVIYDIVQKPSIKQKNKSGETKEEYQRRLALYYSSGKQDALFYQEVMEHPDYTSEKIFKDVNKTIKLIYDCKTEDDFTRTTEACCRYSEDSYCSFLDICMRGNPTDQNLRMYRPRVDLSKYGDESLLTKPVVGKVDSINDKVDKENDKVFNKEYADKLKKTFSTNKQILPKRR
jgi:hypothetical protein